MKEGYGRREVHLRIKLVGGEEKIFEGLCKLSKELQKDMQGSGKLKMELKEICWRIWYEIRGF